mgnify:CR=1 FL=1
MSEKRKPHDVESSTNMKVQRKFWLIEKVVWGILGLVVVWAAIGGTGRGPISKRSVSDKSGNLVVEYQHYLRFNRPEPMRVLVKKTSISDTLNLWIDRKFYDDVDVEKVYPQPIEMQLLADKTVFKFLAPEHEKTLLVTFVQKPSKPWSYKGQLGVIHGPSVLLSQFIYP